MAARVEGCLPESGRVPSQDVERRPTHQLLEVVLRGIAETMLPDGTRRLTITCDTACSLDDLASIAHERWMRRAHVDGMTVRYVRCVETRWDIDGLIGGVFEAELEKA